MKNLHESKTTEILEQLPLSPPSPCSYYLDRQTQQREFRLKGEFPPDEYDQLLADGYRRCGDVYYQVNCPACSACRSYRILVDEFELRRSHRRVLKRNDDVQVTFGVPAASRQKEDLYLEYQYAQHHLKDLQRKVSGVRHIEYDPDRLVGVMYFQMYTNPESTIEIELHLDGQLIGFGIIDVTDTSGSAVYFVYTPELPKRSLGTLAILHGIDWAKSQGMRYYYLGYHIPGHPKMDYKRNYQPAEYRDTPTRQWLSMAAPSS